MEPASVITTQSVNVPPISTPMRYLNFFTPFTFHYSIGNQDHNSCYKHKKQAATPYCLPQKHDSSTEASCLPNSILSSEHLLEPIKLGIKKALDIITPRMCITVSNTERDNNHHVATNNTGAMPSKAYASKQTNTPCLLHHTKPYWVRSSEESDRNTLPLTLLIIYESVFYVNKNFKFISPFLKISL